MNAGVQIKSFYPFNQSLDQGNLQYQIISDQATFCISNKGAEKGSSSINPQTVREFIQPYKYSESQEGDNQIKLIFQELLQHLSPIYNPGQEYEKLIAALFIQGSYMFQYFEYYPNLWCYIPRIQLQERVEAIFKGLCFNGVVVSNSYPTEAITACIEKLSPTLIIHQYQRNKAAKNEFLHSIGNSKDAVIPTKDLEVIRLYCPKVFLSNYLPTPQSQNHALSMIINNGSIQPFKMPHFDDMRGKLLWSALKLQDKIATGGSPDDQYELIDPLLVLASQLVTLDAITESAFRSLGKEFSQRKDSSRQNVQFTYVNDILLGINEFLKQHKQKYVTGFIPLSDIVYFLRELDTVDIDFSERVLSRFINRFQLLQTKPKRSRNSFGMRFTPSITSPNTTAYKQVTTVKIDEGRLEQLLATDIQYI